MTTYTHLDVGLERLRVESLKRISRATMMQTVYGSTTAAPPGDPSAAKPGQHLQPLRADSADRVRERHRERPATTTPTCSSARSSGP